MRLDNQDRSGIENAAIEGTDDLCLRHLEGLGVAAEVAVIERYYGRTAVRDTDCVETFRRLYFCRAWGARLERPVDGRGQKMITTARGRA